MSARTLARAALPLLILIAAVASSRCSSSTSKTRARRRAWRVRTDDAVRADPLAHRRLHRRPLRDPRPLPRPAARCIGREFAAQVRGADVAARYPGARGVGVAERRGDRLIVRRVAPLALQPLGAGAGRRLPGRTGGRTARRGRRDRAAARSPPRSRCCATAAAAVLVFLAVRAAQPRRHGDRRWSPPTGSSATPSVPRPPADVALYDLGPSAGRGRRPVGVDAERSPPARAPTRHPTARRTARFSELGRRWALRYAPRQEVLAAGRARGAVDRARRRAAARRPRGLAGDRVRAHRAPRASRSPRA